MRFSKFFYYYVPLVSLLSCGPPPSTNTNQKAAGNPGVSLPAITGANVMSLTVNGSNCQPNSDGTFPNNPCLSVTVCPPDSATSGAANCQTIGGILLDTGSIGLRIYSSAMTPALLGSLTPVASGTDVLTECMTYGDGSAQWGPVAQAQVFLGGEPGVKIPIHVINSGYGGSGSTNGYQICNTYAGGSSTNSVLDTSPANSGFNGILGVGLFQQDCGPDCTSTNSNINTGQYYACTGTVTASSSCNSHFVAVPLSKQVPNPVAQLPQDNNGVVVALPSLPGTGALFANGYLILGIGTQPNNQPGSVTTMGVSTASADFKATFNGSTIASFLDTGSNVYFMPTGSSTSGLVDCGQFSSSYAGDNLLCPSGNSTTDVVLSTTLSGTSGSPTQSASINVGNIPVLFNSSNWVFSDIAASSGATSFSSTLDLGLPFYFGKTIYHGFNGTTSSLGSGPYWAF